MFLGINISLHNLLPNVRILLTAKKEQKPKKHVCHVANMDSRFSPLPITSSVYKYLMSSLRFSFFPIVMCRSFMFLLSIDAIEFHSISSHFFCCENEISRMINCNLQFKRIDREMKWHIELYARLWGNVTWLCKKQIRKK